MRMKEMSGDGVQPADLKRMGKADAKVYVHKDGKTILVPASKKDEYMAKGYKLSALRAEDQDTDESGIMYRAGVKKYGKDGMKKIHSAAGKGASAEETGKIKDQHNKKKKESVQEDLAQMAQKVEQDHEVQMARSDLYKAAKYSIALHEMLKNVSEEQGIEGWVAAKITKASDYLSSVKHYMEYDMMESKQVTEAMACNCDENCSCGGNCTSGCNCKPGCGTKNESTFLDEGWLDDLKKLGSRGLDKMKALYDPATAAKVKADDMATADAGTMFKDITTVHAMNQQDMSQGYDNNTVLAYLKKYIEPRNPKAFLDLRNSSTPLTRLFPVNGKMTKQALQGNLQKVGQILQKVDLTPEPQGGNAPADAQPQTASIDYKQSMHKKFEAKLKESTKKAVLEDFVGKPISEEEFDRLAEKQDACYHKVKARYKVWPSAYASGALVQCRKKGAANWGNSKK